MVAEKTAKKDKAKDSVLSGKVTVEFEKKYIIYAVVFLLLIIFLINVKDVDFSFSKDVSDSADYDDIGRDGADAVPDRSQDISEPDPLPVPDLPVDIPDKPLPEPEVEDDTYLPVAGEVVVSLGGTAETELLDVTFHSFEIVSNYTYQVVENGTEMTDYPMAGKVFIIADFSVLNKHTSSMYMGYGRIILITGDGYIYDPIRYEGYDGLPRYEKVYSGNEIYGPVIFEIPFNSEDLKIQYSFSGLSMTQRFATWFL